AEAEDRRWAAEQVREERERRNADPAADEQRPVDVEPVPVAERAEDRKPFARLYGTESPRARADRVDQERHLAGGPETEAHRARQRPARRFEHEELARDARLEPAPLHAQQRVRPYLLGARDPSSLGPHRFAPGGRLRSPVVRGQSPRPRPRRPRWWGCTGCG